MYVDVHAHLTHERFLSDVDEVIKRAEAAGVTAIVENGLEPQSNRRALALAARHAIVKPALGIYPTDGLNEHLPLDFPHKVAHFKVDDELAFIREQALAHTIVAVGEIGLDGYWHGPETFALQEKLFVALLSIAKEAELPVIVHCRKCEARTLEILADFGATKVILHCFGGRVALAKKAAEAHGWRFSIPANARVNPGFAHLLAELPPECLLTETDSPYLGPVRGERNEPANVVGTIAFLAELRGWSVERAQEVVWQNYLSACRPS